MSFKEIFRSLGPGVITGAADVDPATIGTYSQAGTQFGFGMVWLALFQYPMMAIVQEMCARIGLVTGSGLGAVIREKYSRKIALTIASLILVANTINIGADIGVMAASIKLFVPQIPTLIATVSFIVLILASEILISYRTYVKILTYLTLSLLSYVVTATIVSGNLEHLLVATVIPHFEVTPGFTMMFIAIFGATLTPYAFFWQASQEAEEDIAKGKVNEISEDSKVCSNSITASRIVKPPKISKKEVKMMRLDTAIGMAFSQIIMWAIITTTAGSLHAHNITDIQTADQAAKTLQPLVKTFPNAGEIAKVIFAVGIIGTGLLAIPVMAGSSAYVLSDVFEWKQGLNKKFSQAKAFYFVIAASTIIGLWMNFSTVDPIKALVYTSVINGLVAPPVLVTIISVANDKMILKGNVNSKLQNIIAWFTVVIMAVSIVIFLFSWGH
ncbi:MAG TPA: Nramp family divalent metal transporter [Candidatus Bathyarchaeia archaeon]|nr:Nramp family divalent metal transporter [Candidatus Bathyarchaeia archaeon]